ncbi:hypothetical protein BT69DRAFT_890918 [Atractiella rhizophila]|nr:hypothetical protein BT69DRAFT_890918 [Atractiella rhizophila]
MKSKSQQQTHSIICGTATYAIYIFMHFPLAPNVSTVTGPCLQSPPQLFTRLFSEVLLVPVCPTKGHKMLKFQMFALFKSRSQYAPAIVLCPYFHLSLPFLAIKRCN